MGKGVYVGAPKFELRSLPNGYTQIEYIESNGDLENDGQYINTGIVPETSIFSVEMKVQTIAATTAENWFLTINNDISTTGGANFLNVGTHGGQFRIHLTGITVAGADSVKTDPVDILFTVNGSTASLGGDCNYSVSNANFQTGPYRNYPIYLMIRSSCRFYYCKIKKNDVLVRDLVPCKDTTGAIGMYDLVDSKFYTNDGSGTFIAGGEPTDVARKVKKLYYGVENLAHKVKRGFIGIGGVARLFYSGEIFDYYGPVSPLSNFDTSVNPIRNPGISTPTHAIFPAGYTGGWDALYTVDAYDSNLTHTNPANLSAGHRGCGVGNVGQYGLVAGGYRTDVSSSLTNVVEVYDSNLTKSNATAMRARRCPGGASTENHILFAAGRDEDRSNLAIVDVYDANLTRSAGTNTTIYGEASNSISFNGHAVIFWSSSGVLNMYDSNLVRTQTNSNSNHTSFAVAGNSNYLLAAGGYYDVPDRDATSIVEVWDKNFLKLSNTSLANAIVIDGVGFSSPNAAVFFAGWNGFNGMQMKPVPGINVFDQNLVRTNPEFSWDEQYDSVVSASIGGYCIAGGGKLISTLDDTYDMYAFSFG